MILEEELKLVEEALQSAVTSDVSLLAMIGRQVIHAGGKRLRPKALLLAYKATGGRDIAQAVPLAAAIELIHTASLIHDDINDHSDLRRGEATINARWGNNLALLAGDFVFTRLLKLIAAFDAQVLQIVADACIALVEGETAQMVRLRDADMTEDAYLRIVSQKTGALFAACTELGGIVAQGTRSQVAALREYGLKLGMAFQIRDDALDLIGAEDKLGKPVGQDLEQGVMNLAVLYATHRSERTQALLAAHDIEGARRCIREVGAIEYAMCRAKEYADNAQNALSALPPSEARAALEKLADFALARSQ